MQNLTPSLDHCCNAAMGIKKVNTVIVQDCHDSCRVVQVTLCT